MRPTRPPKALFILNWQDNDGGLIVTMEERASSEASARLMACSSALAMFGVIVEAKDWTIGQSSDLKD